MPHAYCLRRNQDGTFCGRTEVLNPVNVPKGKRLRMEGTCAKCGHKCGHFVKKEWNADAGAPKGDKR